MTTPQTSAPVRRVVITRAVLGVLTLGACIYFTAVTPYFLTVTNLLNLLNDLALSGVVALPATFLVMTGQVDLSVGSGVALTGVVLAITAPDIGLPLAIVCALGTGVAIGLVNGTLATVGRVNSVAATVGTAALVRGLAYLLPGGLAIVIPGLHSLANARPFWGIAAPTLVVAGLAVVAGLLSRSRAGRRSRAIGRIPSDDRLDAHPDRQWILLLFLVSGLAAGLAGLLSTSQLGVGLPTAAIGLELTVLTAVLLGGGHLTGGRGSVAGTLLALALMSVIDNGLSLENLSAYINQVVTAALFVVALVIDGPFHPGRQAGRAREGAGTERDSAAPGTKWEAAAPGPEREAARDGSAADRLPAPGDASPGVPEPRPDRRDGNRAAAPEVHRG